MIERAQMTELVEDDIISQGGREERDSIIEGQIPLPGTTPPARLLIANGDLGHHETVMLIEMFKSFQSQLQGGSFVLNIFTFSLLGVWMTGSLPKTLHLVNNPSGLISQKLFNHPTHYPAGC